MPAINPYLNFPGNTEDAFNFYKSVFGGEFLTLQRFKDTPDAGNLPAGVENQVMHVALPIGKNNILMGTDAPESMGFKLEYGNTMHISLEPETREETKRLYEALSVGGKVTMELQDMFWGAYFGSCTDKYGINWMFNCTEKAS